MSASASWWNPYAGLTVASAPDKTGRNKLRTVTGVDRTRAGVYGSIHYTDDKGVAKFCWITTWRRWCKDNKALSVVQK